MNRALLICLLFLLFISQSNAYMGCCINPQQGACKQMDSESCCPATYEPGSIPESQGECLSSYFYKSDDDAACALLPNDGRAEKCQQGCCCMHSRVNEGADIVTAKQSHNVECQGPGFYWERDFRSCDKAFCESKFGVIAKASDFDKKKTTTTLSDEEPTSEESTTATSIGELTQVLNPADTSKYPDDKCARQGGICRRGFLRGGILAAIGLVPWCDEGENRIGNQCGGLKACCQPAPSEPLKPMSFSDTSYQLTLSQIFTGSSTKAITFDVPQDGTLFYTTNILDCWFPIKKGNSRVYLNSVPIAALDQGEDSNQISVKNGDKVFAIIEGNFFLTQFLFCWNSRVNFDLVFGTSSGKGLGTDIILEEFVHGFPLSAYVGEASDEPIIECSIDWGDGNTESVPTPPQGQIHSLEHEYAEALTIEADIKYSCRTENQFSESTGSIYSSVECIHSSDCEGKSHDVECAGGDWSCSFDSCVWDCPNICDTDSDCAEQQPVNNCKGGFFSCQENQCIWNCDNKEGNPDNDNIENSPDTGGNNQALLNDATDKCLSYCQSEDAAVQANFFNINIELEPVKDELGLEGTSCLYLLTDISKCSESFKTGFNQLGE